MKTTNNMQQLLTITGLTAAIVFISACGSQQAKTAEETTAPAPALPHQILVAGETGNRYFVDENKNTLFGGAKFYNTYEFKNGYCVVSKMVDGKEFRGIIDSTGKEVIPCTQDAILDDVWDGMVKYSSGGKYGYLDLTGKLVIPCEYSNTKGFSGGLVKLEKNYSKWGILDRTGKVIVPFEYEKIGVWGDGLASVKKNGKWGFFNKAGELQIAPAYDFAWGFEQGVCLVGKGKKYALINTKNEQLTDFIFDGYQPIVDVYKNEFSNTGFSETNERLVMEEGLMIVSKDKLWGMIDTKGQAVLPYEYTRVDVPQAGKVEVTKDDKRGSFDLKTKNITWY
jgi:hypothetical protein